MNYEAAATLFATARNPEKGKPLTNNTRLWRSADSAHYYITLHGNTIIRIYPTGWMVYNCGWRTVTTKDRLNRYLPQRIFQRNFKWFVITSDGTYPFTEGMFLPFHGGAYMVRLDGDGGIISDKKLEAVA